MKKLILAGIVIIICCLVFLIVRQNSLQANIGMDIYNKPYPVPFGEWVIVYLNSFPFFRLNNLPDYAVLVRKELSTGYSIVARYNSKTEGGKLFYNELFPLWKEIIKKKCEYWTLEGYPISLNDFVFDIQEM